MTEARRAVLVSAVLLAMTSCACHRPAEDATVSVAATTTIVGDIVRAIAGSEIPVSVVLPVGIDPHSFEPTPRDVSALSRARLVFANGRGLEEFLAPLLGTAVVPERIVELSASIEPSLSGIPDPDPSAAQENVSHDHALPDGHDHGDHDPHVWFVPAYVATWARVVAASLSEIDPSRASLYEHRADSLASVLGSLDDWICRETASIPLERRVLVTDHAALGLFAQRYGFREIGAVLSSFSTMAEPSARDMAVLLERIREHDVAAVFVGVSANAQVAHRVAEDAGIRVVRLYIGSLSPPGGSAADYVSFMRYNVSAIVSALKDGA